MSTLLWAKHRIARHTIASVRRESKLKVAVVSLSAAGLWLGIFFLARFGFGLFEIFGQDVLGTGGISLTDLVMARLLSVFALALFVMLVFSNVLIAFSTLYRSREVAYLIRSPMPTSAFFLGRFYECVTFSSWASAFLGSPVMLAYGLETGAGGLFYLALVAFYLPFVTIPAALGAMITIIVVRGLAGRRRSFAAVLVALILAALFGFFRGELALPSFGETPSLQTVITALGQVQSPFLPSYWLAQGVLGAATGSADSVFYFLLLLSNALLLVWLATLAAERWFYHGWSTLAGGDTRSRTSVPGILSRLDRWLRWLPEPTRGMVAKDLRLFWRDSAQWSQFVLFFGIMALYIANLRPSSGGAGDDWRVWRTLLNLGASMLILASLTTRFIYPLISLEGRRFWILGLSPVTFRQIVWQKFWLSVVTTSVFTISLAVLSATRLELDRTAFGLSVAGIIATTFALSGLAVGLGSLYPNFQEDNPARIVSGMGGTLNFLMSMLYIALVGVAQAAVLLWGRAEAALGGETYPWVVAGAAVWILVITVITCWLP
ncbi:MAG: hypothetical protein AAF657_02185, partial [Acidobacteriota bacterium]